MVGPGLFGIVVAEVAQHFRQRGKNARIAFAFRRRARRLADATLDLLDLQCRGPEERGDERGAAAGRMPRAGRSGG